jgi:DNA mismatch repair protein MutS2
LLAIADTLEAAGLLRRHVHAASPGLVRLRHLAAGLSPLPDLTAEVRLCLAPDGVVLDAASPTLARLRAEARRTREAVRATLQALVTSPALQPIIVEPVITLRNDRYVIPVTLGYRAQLPGVIQDQSGSGHTLFLEPLAVVELNNAIRRLEREAEVEVDRILLELTGRVRIAAQTIGQTVEAFAQLDLILAKARLAERWYAAEPHLTPQGALRLRAVRHPLLLEARRGRPPEEGVVPIDVDVGPTARVLVITGPNTGGKTVALKTVGLAIVMAQAGLHIPASGDSELPTYETVFADIGDEQSIAQDLSTFSAHVARLRILLGQVGPRSLVLVDEIGAGTDPGEGAALGCAILEELSSSTLTGCALCINYLSGSLVEATPSI